MRSKGKASVPVGIVTRSSSRGLGWALWPQKMVEMPCRNLFKNLGVLYLGDALDFFFKIRMMKEGGIKSLAGDEDFARDVNKGFNILSFFAFILGLNVNLDTLVLDFRVEAAHSEALFSFHYYTLQRQYIKI